MSANWEALNQQSAYSGTQSLVRASQSLQRTQQTALETEQIGYSVISDLDLQREALQRTRNNLENTDGQLAQSQKILNLMHRRVFANKFILIAIIVTEVLIIGIVVYMKYFK